MDRDPDIERAHLIERTYFQLRNSGVPHWVVLLYPNVVRRNGCAWVRGSPWPQDFIEVVWRLRV